MTVETDNQQLLQFFWDLADEKDTKRTAAAEKLITELLTKQKYAEDSDELSPDLKYTLGRLVGGLGSSRKYARVGFSTALTSLLHCFPSSLVSADHVFDLMGEKLKLGNTKSEDREILFGRAFCMLSLLESDRLKFDDTKANVLIQKVAKELIKISKAKVYVHRVAMQGLTALCGKVSSATFEISVWPLLSHGFQDGWETCTPDMLQLLLVCAERHPQACGKTFLKTNGWIPQKTKRGDVIGQHCFKHLARILAETTPCQPEINPLSLEIISKVSCLSPDLLAKFWSDFLQPNLLSSSPERKCLAIKLAVYLLPQLNQETVAIVWSSNLLIQIYYSLLNKDHYLHCYCKDALPLELSEAMKSNKVSPNVQLRLLFQLLQSPGGIYLDSVTHSGVVSSVVGHLKLPALLKYIEWLKKLFLEGSVGDSGLKELNLDVARSWSSTQLAHLVRMIHLPRKESWILSILKFLFFHGHFNVKDASAAAAVDEAAAIPLHFMELSDATQSKVGQTCHTILTWLNNMMPVEGTEDCKAKRIPGIMSNGEFWLDAVIRYADTLIGCEAVSLTPRIEFDEQVKNSWKEAVSAIGRMAKLKKDAQNGKASEATALQLLVLHVALQMLSSDPGVQRSAIEVADDLHEIIRDRFRKGKAPKSLPGKADAPHWVEVIVEILLGMMSQESRSVRIIANQVFRLVSSHLTRPGLQLIVDVLRMKDDELMKDKDEDSGEEEEEEDPEEEQEANPDEENDSLPSDQSESESSEDEGDKQEGNQQDHVDEEFRKRIKEALGDVAAPSDESEDDEDGEGGSGSESDADLSDDAMMRIDHVLADIFRQRKKLKKSTKKNNKQNVTHFQLRCVELLETFIQRQHETNPLVLELVRPLLDVVEAAMRDPGKAVLAERATVILRVKLCKMKGYPRNLDDEQVKSCHADMEQILGACERTTGGVFISQLSSHCCMLLLRVLSGNVNNEKGSAVDVPRVCAMYTKTLDDYMTRRDSRVQQCVLQDFVSRYPNLAKHLAEPLTWHVQNGVLLFRKGQACQLLQSLYTCSVSAPHMQQHSKKLLETVLSVLRSLFDTENAIDFKPKHVSELLRLLYHPVHAIHQQDTDYDWSETSTALTRLLELPQAKRSQEITNLTWKVLGDLGSSRPKQDKSKKEKREKKEKKQKRNRAQSENEQDSGEPKESRRERRRRVLKEKKAAKKAKGGKSKKRPLADAKQGANETTLESDANVAPKKKVKKTSNERSTA